MRTFTLYTYRPPTKQRPVKNPYHLGKPRKQTITLAPVSITKEQRA